MDVRAVRDDLHSQAVLDLDVIRQARGIDARIGLLGRIEGVIEVRDKAQTGIHRPARLGNGCRAVRQADDDAVFTTPADKIRGAIKLWRDIPDPDQALRSRYSASVVRP